MTGQRDGNTALRRRSLVTMAVGWPACLLAARPADEADAGGRRSGPEDPLPLTVEDRVYLAVARFEQGFHCAQSVLAAYAGGGLSEEAALKMGAALAGGSTVGGECGAVAAGYLVLGLKHGRTVPAFGDVEKERELFDRIRRFVEEFRRRHGAITCHDLLGVDVFTAEGLTEGRQRGLFRERCPRYVCDAVTILESVSAESPPKEANVDLHRAGEAFGEIGRKGMLRRRPVPDPGSAAPTKGGPPARVRDPR